jgi:ABC-type sugar transport system ATPase subunit
VCPHKDSSPSELGHGPQVRGLSLAYGPHTVLDRIDLALRAGEMCALFSN